jgi:RND family efflux transporter MFP subunit
MEPMAESGARKRWMLPSIVVLAIIAVGLLIGILNARFGNQAPRVVQPDKSFPATTSAAKSEAAPNPAARFVGVVLARQSVQLSPKFEGPLALVKVRMGDRVNEGDLIAQLDTSQLKKELAVTQAVELAARSDEGKFRAELAEIQDKLESTRKITKFVSATELKAVESQYQAALAKLESARATDQEKRARVQQLQQTLTNTEIRAPFTGVVAVRYADPGAIVSQIKPIVRLVSDDRFLRFAVPEEQRSALRVGLPVHASFDSQRLAASGTVEKVAPEVDPASGTVFVEAALNGSEKLKDQLPSGSVATVSLE